MEASALVNIGIHDMASILPIKNLLYAQLNGLSLRLRNMSTSFVCFPLLNFHDQTVVLVPMLLLIC